MSNGVRFVALQPNKCLKKCLPSLTRPISKRFFTIHNPIEMELLTSPKPKSRVFSLKGAKG